MSEQRDPLTLEGIRGTIADLLYEPPSAIADDEDLIEFGLDSVRVMTLVEQWRRHGVEVTFVELAENPTVAAWYRLVADRGVRSDAG